MNKRIKRFITKCHNKEKDAYCWINTNKKLKELMDAILYLKTLQMHSYCAVG